MFSIWCLDKVFLVLLRALSGQEKEELNVMLEDLLKDRTPANDNAARKERDFLVD